MFLALITQWVDLKILTLQKRTNTMTAKIGDSVRFLNDVGGGTIVKIKGNMAYVADEDGFETPILLRECVVVGAGDAAVNTSISDNENSIFRPTEQDSRISEEPQALDTSETTYGDTINITLGFEPHDLKHLSTTRFNAWLVNDSNYYHYFAISSRSDDNDQWNSVYVGLVEPNTQLPVMDFGTEDLQSLEHISLQIISFKQDRNYKLKMPVAFESRLDTTKFAKLHCFKPNQYFDSPVIAIDIVKDDKPCCHANDYSDLIAIRNINETKEQHKPQSRRVSRRAQKNENPLVVDLHASEILDNLNGLSNADILNYQVDIFRRTMDENLTNFGRRIIFIHGKGDGVLRQALLKELNYRYSFCTAQDASFREYGYGATQVTINKRQHKQ